MALQGPIGVAVQSEVRSFLRQTVKRLTQSSVFRDAPCDNTGPKFVAFPKGSIETKDVLSRFLHLAAVPDCMGSTSIKTGDRLNNLRLLQANLDVVVFLQKYECESILQRLLLKYCARLAQDHMWGWQAFCLGAVANCAELCMTSLRFPFAPPSSNTTRAQSIPPQVWERLSPRYTHALSMADGAADDGPAATAFIVAHREYPSG